MHNKTKIQLSAFEQDIIKNADWILTKNQIIEKMKLLLQECLEIQKEMIEQKKILFPEKVMNVSPKISRGENYKGLPWLMLDYPRFFDKENVFAIRTFFWWGNYFSTTIHLSGTYQILYGKKIAAAYPFLCKQHFYFCIQETEWEHHFGSENYKPVHEIAETEFQQLIFEKKFIKLSVKFNLDEWNKLPSLTGKAYKKIVGIIS